MLLGFVGMMIYGVGLHVLPRFSGRSLFSERLGHVQFLLANLGLLVMVAGWLALHEPTVTTGGLMAWAAMALFALNIALTVRHYGPRGA
jgi:cbb3-type cytochrome oxidase subunit 1